MVNKVSKAKTADLVYDFVDYKLRKAGHELYAGGRQPTTAPSNTHRIMRTMGDEFETAFFNSFDDMTSSINVHGEDLEDVFTKILNVTFDSGINWGRIVGAFVFAARLAVKAKVAERGDVVDSILKWTIKYLEQQKFANWINQQGGWDGFEQFYRDPRTTQQQEILPAWSKIGMSLGLSVVSSFATLYNTIRS